MNWRDYLLNNYHKGKWFRFIAFGVINIVATYRLQHGLAMSRYTQAHHTYFAVLAWDGWL